MAHITMSSLHSCHFQCRIMPERDGATWGETQVPGSLKAPGSRGIITHLRAPGYQMVHTCHSCPHAPCTHDIRHGTAHIGWDVMSNHIMYIKYGRYRFTVCVRAYVFRWLKAFFACFAIPCPHRTAYSQAAHWHSRVLCPGRELCC